MRRHVVAVDVGTRSARGGVFDDGGRMLSRAEAPIDVAIDDNGHASQDSENIWQAVGLCVRDALAQSGLTGRDIAAIAFDATCSLVVRDRDGRPLAVTAKGEPRFDTVLWLDHRAIAEAEECTASGHEVLRYCGGSMSPEMQTPKLMWLKRHLPWQWTQAGHFFDLADFLSWRATGSTARSQCTLTAKWTYVAHDGGWRRDFFDAVGLGDMLQRGGLPDTATPTGAAVGPLTPEAAEHLGLDVGCLAAAGTIDAFAGAIGALGGVDPDSIERNAALIAGTSNCIMGMTHAPHPATGIWGPYRGATLPGLWHWEGGQSATGALLDHIIRLFGQGREPEAALHEAIASRIVALREAEGAQFAHGIRVMPDFHGNRTPFGTARATGAIFGLTIDNTFDALCRIYWRTAVSIALGLRHIVEHLAANGYPIDTLHITGGHRRNSVLMELYPDATRCVVIEPETDDAVLLGSAMTAAVAAGWHTDLAAAARAMAPTQRRICTPCVEDRYLPEYRILRAYYDSPFSGLRHGA